MSASLKSEVGTSLAEDTSPFLSDFEFASLTIPKDGDANNSWETSFDCRADKDHPLFAAELIGNRVSDVWSDMVRCV